MNKQIFFLLLATFFLTPVFLADAQPAKIYRIGYLNSSSFSGNAHLLEAFRQRLRELGWVEGKTLLSSTGLQKAKTLYTSRS